MWILLIFGAAFNFVAAFHYDSWLDRLLFVVVGVFFLGAAYASYADARRDAR